MIDWESIQPGTIIQIFFNKGNINNRVIEFRAFVDDRVIYRQQGLYHAEPLSYFQSLNGRGYLSIIGKE